MVARNPAPHAAYAHIMALVTLRLAAPGDCALLLELIRAYHAEDGHDPSSPRLVDAAEAITEGHPNVRAWLLEIDGNNAGYVAATLGFSIEVGGGDAFIDEIYVRPNHRGSGVGTAALEQAIDLCRELGMRRVCLEVELDNERARRLYASRGFSAHERTLMSRWLDGAD